MKRFVMLALLAAKIVSAQEPQSTIALQDKLIADRGYVGIFVEREPDYRVVSTVVPNSPAEKAGIVAGDYILAVDQYSTAEMSPDDFVRHVWAPVGAYMQLTLKRAQTGATQIFQLQRVPPDFRVIGVLVRNSAPANAGMVEGDYDLAIEQLSTADMSLEVFSRHLSIPIGAYKQFTLKRAKTGAIETLMLQRVDPATLKLVDPVARM